MIEKGLIRIIDRATFNYVPVKVPSRDMVPLYPFVPETFKRDMLKLAGTFCKHQLFDVDPWQELMKREFHQIFPRNFGFFMDVHISRKKRYLRKYAWVKNSEIWHLDNVDDSEIWRIDQIDLLKKVYWC